MPLGVGGHKMYSFVYGWKENIFIGFMEEIGQIHPFYNCIEIYGLH